MSNTSTASLSEVTNRARWRYAKDRAATVGVSLGGVGVIGAVVLIFFYLLWVVLPLFFPAKIEAVGQLQSPANTAETLFLAMEEQAEMGLRVGADGAIVFFSLEDGSQTHREQLPSALSAVTAVDAPKGQLAALGTNGQLYRFRHAYRLEYPQGAERVIKPRIEFPLGEEGLSVGEGTALAVGENDNRLLVAVSGAGASQLRLLNYEKSSSFLDDSISLDLASDVQLPLTGQADQLIIDPLLDWLYV
ncbi:MAG: phosphate ABC transporter permease, partial [Oceanococcaceae bacterium]